MHMGMGLELTVYRRGVSAKILNETPTLLHIRT